MALEYFSKGDDYCKLILPVNMKKDPNIRSYLSLYIIQRDTRVILEFNYVS